MPSTQAGTCERKTAYTKKEAATTRNRRRKRGIILRAYPCPVCHQWHLTKSDAGRA